VTNGLLLRSDLHALFDAGQLAVHLKSRVVYFAEEARALTEYDSLHGVQKLRGPQPGYEKPAARQRAICQLGGGHSCATTEIPSPSERRLSTGAEPTSSRICGRIRAAGRRGPRGTASRGKRRSHHRVRCLVATNGPHSLKGIERSTNGLEVHRDACGRRESILVNV
jgi:HNH endonuclease